jgi:hypothetical protein
MKHQNQTNPFHKTKQFPHFKQIHFVSKMFRFLFLFFALFSFVFASNVEENVKEEPDFEDPLMFAEAKFGQNYDDAYKSPGWPLSKRIEKSLKDILVPEMQEKNWQDYWMER